MFEWAVCHNELMSASLFSPTMEDVGLKMQPEASWPASWGPQWVTSPKNPLGMSSVPKASTKSVMMYFLQAISVHSYKILWL